MDISPYSGWVSLSGSEFSEGTFQVPDETEEGPASGEGSRPQAPVGGVSTARPLYSLGILFPVISSHV